MSNEPIQAHCGCLECRILSKATADDIERSLGVKVVTEFPPPEKSLRWYSIEEVEKWESTVTSR